MSPSQQQQSRLKLAGTYLAIIMTMSVIFSFVLYSVSSHELDRSLRRVPQGRESRDLLSQAFDEIRRIRLEESRAELQKKLILFNLVTLSFGGLLSYMLAREALRPIEETLAAQQRFTSDASHELRTPLTAMRSEIEVTLRDKNLTTKIARETLSSNLEEISKLEALTAGLLQLARYKEQDHPFKTIPVTPIVEEALARIEPLAKSKKIIIENSTPKNAKTKGDTASIEQVLVILLDNAIKYSPVKSTITVTTHTSRNHVIVSVKDQGQGINKADLPHIFDRFYRSDAARTKNTGTTDGYGLGLAIAKQIVDAHNGDLELSSSPNTGTTAKLTLPKA